MQTNRYRLGLAAALVAAVGAVSAVITVSAEAAAGQAITQLWTGSFTAGSSAS